MISRQIPEQIVHQPAAHQHAHADRERRAGADVRHAWVDHIGRASRQQLLLDLVECTAVQQPDLAQRSFRWRLDRPQVAIKPVEQQRVADPHDPSDHMRPAHEQIKQLANG